jgi:transposase
MLAPLRITDKPAAVRWRVPPWTTASDEWIRIDRSLAADHPARIAAAIVALLDLGPRERTYAGVGSEPLPPGLVLALVLYELDIGELSPVRWAVHCRENDPAKWLVFGLHPSASTLYAFRQRVGPLLDGLNRQILERAIAAGLTTAEHAAGDGTFVAALGSRHRLVNAATLARRLEQLEEALAADDAAGPAAAAPAEPAAAPPAGPDGPPPPRIEAPAPAAPPPGPAAAAGPAAAESAESATPPKPADPPGPSRPAWMATTPTGRRRQHRRHRRAAAELQRRLGRHRKTRSKRKKARRRPDDRVLICPSEPEAVLGRDKTKVFRPLYNVQLGRDLESPLILAYDVVPQANDAGCFGPLLDRAEQLSGVGLKEVVADSADAAQADLRIARGRGVTIYAPVSGAEGCSPAATPAAESAATPGESAATPGESAAGSGRRRPAVLPKESFAWLEAEQTYECPAGHRLELVSRGREGRAGGAEVGHRQYRCPPRYRRECPLAARCTKAPQKGRTIKRSDEEELVEALRRRMGAESGRERYKLRKQTVELGNADFKAHRGLLRFHSFGLDGAKAQVGLLVLRHNGKVLVKALDAAGRADVTPSSEAA